ncbi:Qat anti-phage system TatD family nuclease QatD [Vibrio coralliilyticus]|uniref:Qat anti-phage system TatD family nuclease QatD n=1 Tax=Vibrio coralliilyticus TaxID=190893 RepID=UPI000C1656E2|nr:Qat anti-phage system TatD family nuclease QatD [Vibrio coralliilyticus]
MIDFHNHLDLYTSFNQVADEVRKRQIYLLSVTTTPSAYVGTKLLEGNNSRIRTALGLHPQLAHERISELPIFEKYISDTRYVGEIGLDGSKEFRQHYKKQSVVFDTILQTCKSSGGKIMSIHSRGAASEVVGLLQRQPDAGKPVLHWFSGTKSQLRAAINIGCWFSIGPAMLNSKKSVELISMLPKNRVLPETDGPFAKLNNNVLMPWDSNLVVEKLSQIWKVDFNTANTQVHENLKTLVSSV